jgi:RND family efflux transporter MFP subunit
MMKQFFYLITDRPASLLKRYPYSGALVIATSAILIGLVSLLALAGNGDNTLPPPDPIRVVRVAEVQADNGEIRLRLPGVVQAAEHSDLAFLHPGQLAQREVTRGQVVAVGDTLAILHNPALMPGLSEAQARVREVDEQFEQLQREVRRLEDLHQRNLIPTEELERTISRRNALNQSRLQAQARLDEASEQLAEARLRAPFAGTVVELYAEPGQFVAAGQPILALSGNGPREVRVQLGAERSRMLAIGQAARIESLNDAAQVTARIQEIGQAAPGRAATIVLVLDDSQSNWQPGQGVQVDISFPGPPSLTVPLAAIIDPSAADSRLFRVVNGRALLVPVTLGRLKGDHIGVEGPLAEGDLVVTAGHGQLIDDEPVRILP